MKRLCIAIFLLTVSCTSKTETLKLKLAFVTNGFEVFTMPKYHVIKDLNFFALEAGLGARF